MRINVDKLNETVKKEIPNTENISNPDGFFGYFEEREGYNKLVAFCSRNDQSKFTWIHKAYQA
jgi:hypothetical protein